MRHLSFVLGLLRFLEGGFDPPAVFDVGLLRHQATRRDLRASIRPERPDFAAIEIRGRRLRTRFAARRALAIPPRMRGRDEPRRAGTLSPLTIRRENRSALRSASD